MPLLLSCLGRGNTFTHFIGESIPSLTFLMVIFRALIPPKLLICSSAWSLASLSTVMWSIRSSKSLYGPEPILIKKEYNFSSWTNTWTIFKSLFMLKIRSETILTVFINNKKTEILISKPKWETNFLKIWDLNLYPMHILLSMKKSSIFFSPLQLQDSFLISYKKSTQLTSNFQIKEIEQWPSTIFTRVKWNSQYFQEINSLLSTNQRYLLFYVKP